MERRGDCGKRHWAKMKSLLAAAAYEVARTFTASGFGQDNLLIAASTRKSEQISATQEISLTLGQANNYTAGWK
jgi:hypothetical protein